MLTVNVNVTGVIKQPRGNGHFRWRRGQHFLVREFNSRVESIFKLLKFEGSNVHLMQFNYLKSRQTKKAEFQAINAKKYLQEIVQLEFGAF